MEIQAHEKWEVQLRKGTLELAILAALSGRKRYGLELLNMLHSYETMRITEGTLYPLLDRLKREGVIEAQWQQDNGQRPRKYYGLTELGKEKLIRMSSHWRQSTADMERLLGANHTTLLARE